MPNRMKRLRHIGLSILCASLAVVLILLGIDILERYMANGQIMWATVIWFFGVLLVCFLLALPGVLLKNDTRTKPK